MPTNCLSVFDHFVGLALKGLKIMTSSIPSFLINKFISNLYWTAKFLTLYAPIPQNGGQHTQTVRRQSDVSTEWLNLIKWDALRDLVSFVQFKKREKHPWRSVTFSKVVDQKFFKLYKHICSFVIYFYWIIFIEITRWFYCVIFVEK